MGNHEESVVFLPPPAVHLSNQANSTVCSPFSLFFSITFFFLHSSVFLGSPSEPVYVPWLNKILGNATLQQYQDRFDLHIEQNLKENFAYSK